MTFIRTFLKNRVTSSRVKCLKFNIKRCSIKFSYKAQDGCFSSYMDLSVNNLFCSIPFTKKKLCLSHEEISFQVTTHESSIHIHFHEIYVHSELPREIEFVRLPILLWGKHLFITNTFCENPFSMSFSLCLSR